MITWGTSSYSHPLPPSKWMLRTKHIGFLWFRGAHSRHATHENRISVHATKTITDAEANFEEAWKCEVRSYHKEVKQRVRRLDVAIIYVSGIRFAFGDLGWGS